MEKSRAYSSCWRNHAKHLCQPMSKITRCKSNNFTSYAGMTHVKNFLSQNCYIFSVSSIFMYITQAKQIINLLLLSNFHLVISYRRVQKESNELLYETVWSLVMVRNQLPAQVVKAVCNTYARVVDANVWNVFNFWGKFWNFSKKIL